MIPLIEMKLREAKFFFALLHNTGQQVVGNEPEEFAFYLNAFLSAARAVTFALQYEDKSNYDTWFTSWGATRTEKERELLAFMRNQRNFAEKRGSPEFTADDWEWIPITKITSEARRSHTAYGFNWFMLMNSAGSEPTQVARTVYQFPSFSGDQKEVTSVCKQYVDILDALVKDFVSWVSSAAQAKLCRHGSYGSSSIFRSCAAYPPASWVSACGASTSDPLS